MKGLHVSTTPRKELGDNILDVRHTERATLGEQAVALTTRNRLKNSTFTNPVTKGRMHDRPLGTR